MYNKFQKLIIKEDREEYKRNILNPFKYTHKTYIDFSIYKGFLYYKDDIIVPLNVQTILIAYMIAFGERDYEFTIMNTYKTAYLVSYNLDFNIATNKVAFNAVITNKDYDTTNKCICPDIVGLTYILITMINTLKRNGYLNENNKICGI